MTRALGITDAVNTCDCCGKTNLKCTVEIELDDGDIVHYGRTCAARNTGKPTKVLNSEIRAHQAAQVIAAQKAFAATAEYKANRARFALRNTMNIRPGLESAEFVRETSDAADQAANLIAAQHGVEAWQIRNV